MDLEFKKGDRVVVVGDPHWEGATGTVIGTVASGVDYFTRVEFDRDAEYSNGTLVKGEYRQGGDPGVGGFNPGWLRHTLLRRKLGLCSCGEIRYDPDDYLCEACRN